MRTDIRVGINLVRCGEFLHGSMMLEIYENVRKLRDMAVYDPRRHYEVGDRIWFPDLGTGTVVEKLPKFRMMVDFDKGVQRLLREDIPTDPRQQLSMA